MYNSDLPTRAELPTTAQLIRSTIIAIAAAIAILLTIVLPAEYAIDPTGIGRALQLTDMGEIKKQLHEEAEADRQRDLQAPVPPGSRSSLSTFFAGLLIAVAQAAPQTAQVPNSTDEIVINLRPTEGVEWKLRAARGAQIQYSWRVEGGSVNYDMHGTPAAGGKESSYKSGRSVPSDEGVLIAGYDGSHGWFFRNRGTAPVKITLKTSGAYTDMKRM